MIEYTKYDKTWCSGCVNFGLLESARNAFDELVRESKGRIKRENFVVCSGIGCHGKVSDYLELSSVYALHGRGLATAFGLKAGNPNLRVVVFAGDGDAYDEGVEHLVHAIRYNMDITLIVHYNNLLSLTTGQPSAVSWRGLKNRTAFGVLEEPLNPIAMAISLGASFVARANAMDLKDSKRIIKQAVKHRGFSFVEAVQPCIFFLDTREFFRRNLYKVDESFKGDRDRAMKRALEWNYENKEKKIPYGIFYKNKKPIFEDREPQLRNLLDKKIFWISVKRNLNIKRLL